MVVYFNYRPLPRPREPGILRVFVYLELKFSALDNLSTAPLMYGNVMYVSDVSESSVSSQ